jgi:UDP-GlcNAc:undecaprenyl-phosphate GlcNAc-1-phosphate transferase
MIDPTFVIGSFCSFVAVVMCVPLVRALCARWNLLDVPGPLKIHSRPIPRLGGIATMIGLMACLLTTSGASQPPSRYFLVAIAILFAVGLLDDLREVSPFLRLAVQVVCGLFVGMAFSSSGFGEHPAFRAAFACGIVVVFVNAFNFLDGSDGLAAGVATIIALGYIGVGESSLSILGMAVAWGLFGSCLGFLIFNFPPASIFLGDSGSTVLGICVAFLSLDIFRDGVAPLNASKLAFPFVVAAIPLLDVVFAIVRRVKSGTLPTYGDLRHFYDWMLQKGLSPRRVALATYAGTVLTTIAGWALLRTKNVPLALLLAGIGGAALFGCCVWKIRPGAQPRAPREAMESLNSF